MTARTRPGRTFAAVHTVADGRGDWVVSWTSCTSAASAAWSPQPSGPWSAPPAARPSSASRPTSRWPERTQHHYQRQALGSSAIPSVQRAGILVLGPRRRPQVSTTRAPKPGGHRPQLISHRRRGAVERADGDSPLQVSTQGGPSVQAFGSQSTEFVYRIGPAPSVRPPRRAPTVPGLQAGRTYVRIGDDVSRRASARVGDRSARPFARIWLASRSRSQR